MALDNELAIVRRTLKHGARAYAGRNPFQGRATSEIVFQQAKVEAKTFATMVPDLGTQDFPEKKAKSHS